MNKSDKDMLLRLGAGDSIQAICGDAGLTRAEFEQWWTAQTTERVPSMEGTRTASGVSGRVDIVRDEWGVPHVLADSDDDLFFGYGYATAQDRLWQLDYYRRKAHGRLSEVIGPSGIEIDTVSHTIGLSRTAEANLSRFPEKTKQRLAAYTNGINAFMEETRRNLPIEFDLLGYEPDEWTSLDSVAIWQEFRWYLTGRLPIIAIPELAKRVLGEGPLLDLFLTGEAEDESIIPKSSYPSVRMGEVPVGEVVGDPDEGLGSNNWVVSGRKSTSGAPMVASDPHIAFGAVSCWYEVHLSGPEMNVAGAGYVGVPGIVFGRNETLAWGVTNNICSQRDIYQEEEHPDRPGHFRFGDEWRPAKRETVEIAVKGEDARTITITRTHNGPIVDLLLPEPLRTTDKVSARWLGTGFGDEITGMLDLAAARDCDEAREALRDWIVPTWSYVFGDVEGHIAYQAVGRIPIREQWNREYRPGWDPAHQWQGFIPYDALPALSDPAEGYARSANNRSAGGLPLPALRHVEQRTPRPPHPPNAGGEGPTLPRGLRPHADRHALDARRRGSSVPGRDPSAGIGSESARGRPIPERDPSAGIRSESAGGRRVPEQMEFQNGRGRDWRVDLRALLLGVHDRRCRRAVRRRRGAARRGRHIGLRRAPARQRRVWLLAAPERDDRHVHGSSDRRLDGAARPGHGGVALGQNSQDHA